MAAAECRRDRRELGAGAAGLLGWAVAGGLGP